MPWWACGHCNESAADDVVCLDYNHLSLTEVPSEIFSFERTLEDLYLESNRITDLPRQLFHCHGLKSLNLSDNEISVIPSAISALENLQSLDLGKNLITTLPETIKSCTNLTYLNVSLNPIEKLCDPLTSIISLVELHLNDIYLEFLPANFGRLVNLKILELRENNLITLPKSMSRLVNLTRLDIGQNDFTELPEVVSSLLNLTELWIDTNRIRRLPPNMGQLRKLVHFDASNNCLASLPRDIGYWTKVVEFCVTNNDINEVPSTIGNMKNLVGLKLDDNRIHTLPDSIGKLNNLEELMLAHNDLTLLPETIGLLRKLQILSADKNTLTSIPIEIGSCISLRILSLRSNKLTSIPAELGHISNLRVLNLINNQLQELPVSLLKLERLAALWLSDNQSQPLIPLQQDYDLESSHMFLTCFMLPQIHSDHQQQNDNNNKNVPEQPQSQEDISALHSGRRHICFAPDAGVFEQPHRLSRAPTPYPKELRALARHARSMNRGLYLVPPQSSPPIQEGYNAELPPVPNTEQVEIKEAKVSYKVDLSGSQSNPDNTLDHTEIQHNAYPSSNHSYSNTSTDMTDSSNMMVNRSNQMYVGKTNSDTSIIREAKYVRTFTVAEPDQTPKNPTPYKPSSDSPSEAFTIYSNENSKGGYDPSVYAKNTNLTQQQRNTQTTPQQPPPYYIAAAHSLHAEYFNNLNTAHMHSRLPQAPHNTAKSGEYSKYNLDSPSTEYTENYGDLAKYKLYQSRHPHHTDSSGNLNDLRMDNMSIKSNETSVNMKINTNGAMGNYIEKPPTFIQDQPPAGQHIIAPTPQRLHPVGQPQYPGQPYHMDPNWNSPGDDRKGNCLENSIAKDKATKWLFGKHKNASVMQVVLRKNPDLGFNIIEEFHNGIFISNVHLNGPAYGILKPGDKVLDVDNTDFTKINQEYANEILQHAGPLVNMMISRTT